VLKRARLGVRPALAHKKQSCEREVSETIAFLHNGSENFEKVQGLQMLRFLTLVSDEFTSRTRGLEKWFPLHSVPSILTLILAA
jgi:hypothetical protein